MLRRFWGERSVYATEYSSLVRPSEGGIRSTELAESLERQGYRVRVTQGDSRSAFDALRSRVPTILLLGGGQPTLHYVVLVGADDERVWLHDPKHGPDRSLTHDELARLWGDSEWWTLRASPAANAEDTLAYDLNADAEAFPARPSDSAGWSGADATRARSAGREPDGSLGLVDSALVLLRRGDHAAAVELGRRLVERNEPEVGRRIVATALYLRGDATGALRAWNDLGEPRIDLLRIDGLRHTRWIVGSRRSGLRPTELLTPERLALAERRLAHLPAVSGARVDYRPLPDGSVEARAALVERPRWPSLHRLALSLGTAAFVDELDVAVGPLMAAGDRWRLRGSWNPAQEIAGAAVSAPISPLPGVLTLRLEWTRERFAAGISSSSSLLGDTGGAEERLRAEVGLEEWIRSDTRIDVTLGLERWPRTARAGSFGLSVLRSIADDALLLSAGAAGWVTGGETFGTSSFGLRLTLPAGEHRSWHIGMGVMGASAHAPRLLWPGAGTGRVRGPLLRAHPLVEDARIGGAAFGRTLAHGTVEHRVFAHLGPLRIGGALFLDAARAWDRGVTGEQSRALVDVGFGPFVSLGPDGAAVRLARGESGWVLSVGAAW
jgi:hypothetical protein